MLTEELAIVWIMEVGKEKLEVGVESVRDSSGFALQQLKSGVRQNIRNGGGGGTAERAMVDQPGLNISGQSSTGIHLWLNIDTLEA